MAHALDDTAGSDDDDTTSAIEPARSPATNRRAAVVAGLLAAANAAALAFLSSRYAHQLAGRRNANTPNWFAWEDAIALVVWLATAALLVRAAWAGMGMAQHIAVGGLAACAAALPTGCWTAPSSFDRYEQGLAAWTAARVDADAVRAWNATLPSVSTRSPVPADKWPPAVAAVGPAAVDQLPGGQGIVLQWGAFGTWGNSRRVFVAGMPNGVAPPSPRDELHRWRMVDDGVYVAQQYPG